MDSTPPRDPDPNESPELAAANARSGLILFVLYFALYATFVIVMAFFPAAAAFVPVQEEPKFSWFHPLGVLSPVIGAVRGINLAVLSGLGLILTAVLLSLVYMLLCRWNEKAAERRRRFSPRFGDMPQTGAVPPARSEPEA